jgi:hypothetical protein
LRPSQQIYYDDLATNLQNKALLSAKEAQILPAISETNCSSIFIFSALISMNAIATRRKPDHELHIRHSADWLAYIRGVTSVAKSGKPWLPSGDVAPFLHFGFIGPMMKAKRKEARIQVPSEAKERLNRLQTLITDIEDEGKKSLYTDVINNLQEAFSNYYSLAKDTCGLSVIFQWPAQLSEEYLRLLMSCDPEALVIFAYYAVLMSKLLPCWWLEGRVEWILGSVHSHLGEYHRAWIQWPIEELGWVSE